MESIIPTFNFKEFASHSNNAIPLSLRKNIANLTEELNQLAEDLYEKPYTVAFQDDIVDEIAKKVQSLDSSDVSLLRSFSRKECRYICLFANKIGNDEGTYKKIISILTENWKDSFLRALLRYTISNWIFLEREMSKGNVNPVYDFFIRKLEQYTGSNKRICQWKNKIRFLEIRGYRKGSIGGVQSFLQECLELKTILEAPLLLNLRKTDICLDYFQKVICMYCKAKKDIPLDFEQVMDAHKNTDTRKIVLSNYICDTDINQNLKLKQIALEHYALNMIGHPSQLDRWTLNGYDDDKVEKIENARLKVNQWLINKYIDEMFRGFMGDEDRKKFWMKYANHVSEIKIAGTKNIRKEIEYSTSLRDTLDYCFIQTSRKGMSRCTFLMRIKDAIIVEFSEKNKVCVYIYRDISPVKQVFNQINSRFNEKYLAGSIDELFKQSIDSHYPTISRFNILDYGKIRHFKGTMEKWDETLDVWIQRKLNIYV